MANCQAVLDTGNHLRKREERKKNMERNIKKQDENLDVINYHLKYCDDVISLIIHFVEDLLLLFGIMIRLTSE